MDKEDKLEDLELIRQALWKIASCMNNGCIPEGMWHLGNIYEIVRSLCENKKKVNSE